MAKDKPIGLGARLIVDPGATLRGNVDNQGVVVVLGTFDGQHSHVGWIMSGIRNCRAGGSLFSMRFRYSRGPRQRGVPEDLVSLSRPRTQA